MYAYNICMHHVLTCWLVSLVCSCSTDVAVEMFEPHALVTETVPYLLLLIVYSCALAIPCLYPESFVR